MGAISTSPSAESDRSRSVLVALVALGLACIFVLLRLLVGGGDINRLILVGDMVADPEQVPAPITVLTDSTGYDGQYFYRLSLSPFSTDRTAHGIRFNEPALRHQRIGYPLLAWVSSGGRASAAPYALVGVNVVGLALIAYFGALLAQHAGRSPWWGLLVVGYPGFVISLARSLSEIVACAALLGAVVMITRRSWVFAALALTFAALTRESTLVFSVAIVGVSTLAMLTRLLGLRWSRLFQGSIPFTVGIVPVVVFAGWQLLLRHLWQTEEVIASARRTDRATFPLLGLVRQLAEWFTAGEGLGLMRAVWLVSFAVFLVVVPVLVGRRGGVSLGFTVAIATYIGLFLLLPNYEREAFFLRYLADPYVLASSLLLLSRARISERLPQALVLLWVVAAVHYVIEL